MIHSEVDQTQTSPNECYKVDSDEYHSLSKIVQWVYDMEGLSNIPQHWTERRFCGDLSVEDAMNGGRIPETARDNDPSLFQRYVCLRRSLKCLANVLS